MKKVGKKQPLISVIVPVYNVEKYVGKCLDSIINQTYQNLQIIVIDDGSNDSSGKICENYAKKDDRIEVIHQKNGGLANARNTGLKYAKGVYVTFIDSDDWVEDIFVEILYQDIIQNNCNISMVKHFIDYPQKSIVAASKAQILMNSKECLKKLLYADDVDISAWGKLYRSSLFDTIRYPDGYEFEDTVTTPELVINAQRIFLNSIPLYHYQRYDQNSITNSAFTPKKLELIEQASKTSRIIQNQYPELQSACERFILWAHIATLTRAVRNRNDKPQKTIKDLMCYIKEHRLKVLLDKNISNNDKFSIIATIPGSEFYYLVWKHVYCRIKGKSL